MRPELIGRFWIPVVSIMWTASLMAAEVSHLEITRDGMSTSVIVTGETPSEPEKRAAVELHHYLQKISGALIPISTYAGNDTTTRILLGTPTSNPLISNILKSEA